MFLLTN